MTADDNRMTYESQINKMEVDLVVSAFGERYERSYPIYEGVHTPLDNSMEFEQVIDTAVYITLNGPKKGSDLLFTKSPSIVVSSPLPSFGVLDISSKSMLSYTQYSIEHEIIDVFKMEIIDKAQALETAYFKRIIYGILLV